LLHITVKMILEESRLSFNDAELSAFLYEYIKKRIDRI